MSHESFTATKTIEQGTGLSRAHTEGAVFRVRVSSNLEESHEIRPDAPQPLYVGSSGACDIRVPDRAVSRRHLSLQVTGPNLRVVDLESTNGTFVNGIRIESALLRGGERLLIGSTGLEIEIVHSNVIANLWPADRFGRVLGPSAAMRQLFPVLSRFAASDVPVVIEGEPGTGKGLVAEAIHEASERKDGPCEIVPCSTVTPTDLDLLLFGERRVDGTETRGLFDETAGGTLIFDEIVDLPPLIQARLLRVLERKEIARVGSLSFIPVDVRIIATTQSNIEDAVERGRFREDLFLRLSIGRLLLPPLRSREGDVWALAQAFWSQLSKEPLPSDLLSDHVGYRWPGNVRELYNVVGRLAVGSRSDTSNTTLPMAALERAISETIDLDLSFSHARTEFVALFERCYVQRALAAHKGNVSRAAAASGIARRYFHILKQRHKD